MNKPALPDLKEARRLARASAGFLFSREQVEAAQKLLGQMADCIEQQSAQIAALQTRLAESERNLS